MCACTYVFFQNEFTLVYLVWHCNCSRLNSEFIGSSCGGNKEWYAFPAFERRISTSDTAESQFFHFRIWNQKHNVGNQDSGQVL